MKKFICVIILFVAMGMGYLWLVKPSDKSSVTPRSPLALMPKQSVELQNLVPKPAQVAAPVLPPVPASSTTSIADPHAVARVELKAAVSDMIYRLETGDQAGFFQTYMPSDFQAKAAKNLADLQDRANQMRAKQGLPPIPAPSLEDSEASVNVSSLYNTMAPLLKRLNAIKNSEPILNDSDDKATYVIDPTFPSSAPNNQVYFHKENGQWYPGN